MKSTQRLSQDNAALLVVDLQERFRPAIAVFPEVVAACVRLVRSFRYLGLPIRVTEQYPKGLGPTVAEMREALSLGDGPQVPVLEKTDFTACGDSGLLETLSPTERGCVLVCGIETHVCVQQSVHDLLQAGFGVHVAVDAVGSRRSGDKDVALRRLERTGAVLTTSEMAVFELLGSSRHPRFKEVQALFK
jgi:nicotinamidase-related amidase